MIPRWDANFCEQGSSRRGRIEVAVTQIAESPQDERAKVESWRLHVLIEAGYPLPLAERLAGSDADLHRAVEILKSGCTPETATAILI